MMPSKSLTSSGTGHLIPQGEIRAIIGELEAQRQAGHQISQMEHLVAMRRLGYAGGIRTLEAILPLTLNLNGHPYDLQDHFPFSPIFNINMPQRLLLKAARQTSKTTSIASHGIMLSICIEDFKTLFVTPLYEQIRRFSNNFVRPFIDKSPIRNKWVGTSQESNVLQRSFRNGSMMTFSFALLDSERIRGVPADKVAIDEVQNMDPAHLPIIHETMSHSDYSLAQYTGTPKTRDNLIETLWARSSQAEWFIPCYSCREWNIPSQEYHIEAMMGPHHEFISERCPALVCHKCRKPINPRPPHGRWMHRKESKKFTFAGYHGPQIILPLHCMRPDKWAELLGKREIVAPNVFYNEVLGESVDMGQKLVTETDLRAACTLEWENNEREPAREMMKLLKHYHTRILAIDWGGGGEKELSFTALALLGFAPGGKIHVLWGKRLKTPNDHMREAKEVIHWIQKFGVDLVAHDYSGAGAIRETILVQSGFDVERILAIDIKRAATGNLFRHVAATPLHQRAHYLVDKARTFLYTCQAIKLKLCTFFKCDHIDSDRPGLIFDFLALVEEKTQSRYAGDIYTITRSAMLSDDFAQAVNLGCAALWHVHDAWPNFAAVAKVARLTPGQLEAAGHADYGWAEDRTMAGFFNQP